MIIKYNSYVILWYHIEKHALSIMEEDFVIN